MKLFEVTNGFMGFSYVRCLVIAENEEWWINVFEKNNWKVKKRCAHINGLKDNWQSHSNGIGNHVFLLEKS